MPVFSLTIPSTKKKVQYRQFTVREEKMLTQAEESEDLSVIANAVKEIIEACVKGIPDASQLALFDVEYIMTKIRAKSVGEVIDLNLPCDIDSSHPRAMVRVDLDKIEVKIPDDHKNRFDLTETLGVVMKYPSLENLSQVEDAELDEMIAMCIDSIYTPEEVFYAKDQTREELLEFVQSLTSAHAKEIEDKFFRTMPVYEHWVEYECPGCGHKHRKVIRGMANFFA